MYAYDTLTEALNGLKERGFELDFNLQEDSIYCPVIDQKFSPKEFEVKEHHRFGGSDPGDLSEVFAIETTNGHKGVLVDGVGASSYLSQEIIQKLRFRP